MQVGADFYIGTSFHLLDDAGVTNAVRSEMAMTEKVYAALTEGKLEGTLKLGDLTLTASSFEEDQATADDQPLLPVLLYITASFEIPDELTEYLNDSEDELDSILTAELNAAGFRFTPFSFDLI
jgi:hypothetical protein